MITTSRAAWALAGALVLASAACGGTTDANGDTAAMPAVVKIGVPLDTSGAAGIAGVGANEYEGLKLAKDEIESTRFLGGTKIELVFVDTKADKQASVAAVLKMVDKDKVDAIVGFTLTPSFRAAAPQAQSRGVPVIALGLSAPDVTKVGPSVYRILPDVSRMYPARDVTFSQAFSAKTAAYLYNNDTETVVAIHGARKKGLEAAGIETVAEQTMTQKDTDLRTQLTEIKKANPDIIILSTFPGQFASVYLQAD
jgi:branched-chain amino acid transport system substrate-binding protein